MDPVVVTEPVEHGNALAHAIGTAGGGGFIATLLAFFQSRERRALAERVAALESEVASLRTQLDAIAPRRLLRQARQKKR